jgi:uncharacterized protein (DUF362 family)
MTETTVAIVKGDDPHKMSWQALDLIHAPSILRPDDHVLIKPNIVLPKPPSTGVTTDPRVVEGIIEYVKTCGVSKITIAEGGNPETDKAFAVTGLKDVAKRQHVPLVNINKDARVTINIPGATALPRVCISKTVHKSTCIVNVPTLKVHHMMQVTLSLKNLMGVIIGNREVIMHSNIEAKLADLATVIRPTLNIIDGLIGTEMDETCGRPVLMGIIIAGRDIVAVDAVGSAVMGFDPTTIRHLQLAAERRLGIGDINAITVVGESIKAVMKPFSQTFALEKLKAYNIDDPFISREELQKMWEK